MYYFYTIALKHHRALVLLYWNNREIQHAKSELLCNGFIGAKRRIIPTFQVARGTRPPPRTRRNVKGAPETRSGSLFLSHLVSSLRDRTGRSIGFCYSMDLHKGVILSADEGKFCGRLVHTIRDSALVLFLFESSSAIRVFFEGKFSRYIIVYSVLCC